MATPSLPTPVESLTHRRLPETRNNYVRANCHEASTFTSIRRSVLICGDAHQALDLLPDESVQTVVTSPPYWSLRDYQVKDQIGRDDALEDYLEAIVGTFEKLKRVLRHDGTVWLNVGDSYTSGNRRYRAPDRKTEPEPCGCGLGLRRV